LNIRPGMKSDADCLGFLLRCEPLRGHGQNVVSNGQVREDVVPIVCAFRYTRVAGGFVLNSEDGEWLLGYSGIMKIL
jgi:hypothetical protein